MSELKPYQKRMIIEYRQLEHRYYKLRDMLNELECGTLDFKPECPVSMLREQLNTMSKYMDQLEIRSVIEHIDLNSYDPMNDMIEALAKDLCERETMCDGNPHQLDELDAQTQESYREEARMDIEALMKAVNE